jgi:hypothetical protein
MDTPWKTRLRELSRFALQVVDFSLLAYWAQIPMGGSSEDEKEADCEVKFRFLPNSVVAIKTSPTSYHSVPNSNIKHMAGLDRNILTVEWYKTS